MKRSRILAAQRRLGVENLERRAMLAGNVSVSLTGGFLLVNGDGDANHITIYQQANGHFDIAGLDGEIFSGPTSDLHVRNILVNLGAGDDSVIIAAQPDGETEGLLPASVLGTVTVNGHGGSDTIEISVVGRLVGEIPLPNLAVTVDSGAQSDTVVIDNTVTSALTINTWGGDDYVDIYNVLTLAATVNSGDGYDIVEFYDSAALTGNVLLGASGQAQPGNIFTADTSLFGTLNVVGGNGIDDVALFNTQVGLSLNIATLGGADVVTLSSVQTGLTKADIQELADYLVNHFEIDISQLPFDYYALISRLPGVPGFLTVSTGAGDDYMTMNDVVSTNWLGVFLDNGDDQLMANNVNALFGQLNGGLGYDYKYLNSVDSALLVLLFEGMLTAPVEA